RRADHRQMPVGASLPAVRHLRRHFREQIPLAGHRARQGGPRLAADGLLGPLRPRRAAPEAVMNRQVFTAFLSLGASLLGLPAAARARQKEKDDHKMSPVPGPVNVDDFRLRAQARLPKATFDYITTGSADEITLRENVAAFGRLKVLPP